MAFRKRGDRWLSIGALVATAVATWAIISRFVPTSRLPEIPIEHRPAVVVDWREIGSRGQRLGNRTGNGTQVVVFSDYLCHFCGEAWKTLQTILADLPGDLTVVYRHNPALGELSRPAAVAAECAAEQGRFTAMHSTLFEMVDSIGIRPWRFFAETSDVDDLELFDSCMAEGRPQRVVDRDAAEAGRLGIAGTPAVLVDSLLFTGSPGEQYLRAYIRNRSRDDS